MVHTLTAFVMSVGIIGAAQAAPVPEDQRMDPEDV